MRRILIVGAALALAAPLAVHAQDEYQSEPATDTSIADTFAAMDTDLDGSVTEDEFTAYAGDGSESQFAAAAGDDGILTEDELGAFVMNAGEATSDEM